MDFQMKKTNVKFLSVALGFSAGLDEFLPTAREYGEHHLSIIGLIASMAVMAFSLLMFL
ncbi:MAG: zinc transporter ZIP family [Fusobacteria bacterium]|nr:MAG: zinc transporter ZIP family [Fusobacteriota bacterium]KAF0229124.1 MAG: zinc transporter ZIP [Fusobacteriota bacterium]